MDMIEIPWVFDEDRLVLAMHMAWKSLRILGDEYVENVNVDKLDSYFQLLSDKVKI